MTAPTIVCPAWCVRVHDSLPDNSIHESAPVRIPQAPAPIPQDALTLFVSEDMDAPDVRLYAGGYELNLHGAERLLAELALQVERMRVEQARVDAGLLLRGALEAAR